jgi:hypothetical protein
MIYFLIYIGLGVAMWPVFYRLIRQNSPLVTRPDAAVFSAAGAVTWPISLAVIWLDAILIERNKG